MVIYMDLILLENLVMNYIILHATAIVLKRKIKFLRIFSSSLIGAIYTVLAYTNIFSVYNIFIVKIILSILIVYIAFEPKSLKREIQDILIFYLVTFVFGGAAFCFIYIIKPQDIIIKNGLFMGVYPIKTIILATVASFFIVVIGFKIVKNKISKKDIFCKIKFNIEGKELETTAMIDTGNLLKDPISGCSVIVVEKTLLNGYVEKMLLDNIEDLLIGRTEVFNDEIKEKYFPKIKLIPFSSVGKQNGMLVGFKVNNVIVIKEDEKKKIENSIIGIYDKSLTKKGEYRALVGLEFL